MSERLRERAPLIVALAITVAVLLALAPRHLEHWDEIQLELGMRSFDLAWHQPHPPGYVLFVLAGRAVRFVTRAAHPGRVLSLLAVLSWIALVWGSLPRDRAMRTIVPLLLPVIILLSPPLHVHASTGRTYVVESTLWVAICLLVPSRHRYTPAAAGALVGLAGGFRPTVLVFGFAALGAMAVVRRRELTTRQWLELLGALTVTTASWLLALSLLCGGLARYSELSAPLLRDNVLSKSIFIKGAGFVFAERLPAMLVSLWDALGPTLVLPVVLLAERLRRGRTSPLAALDPLLFGAVVAFTFYLLIIFDSPDGYSLSYVLPLLTWTILSLARIEVRPRLLAAAVAALLVAWPFVDGGVATASGIPATRARLHAVADARLAALDQLPAASTLVVTGAEQFWGLSFRLLMYERRERAVLQLARDPFIAPLTLAEPYMAARDHQPRAVGPDGVDLATLPFFSSERPLRHVVLAFPKEAAERIDQSCARHVRRLPTTRGDALPDLELTAGVRVFVQSGRLVCGP